MPVSVAITVTDPPSAPTGYTLCAFEVRSFASNGDIAPVAVFSGTTDGFETAAAILVKAVESSLREVGVGFRLAAVAWFVDKPLTECPNGRERMVSTYDAAAEKWGQWTPEERIGCEQMGKSPRRHISMQQKHGLTNMGTGARH